MTGRLQGWRWAAGVTGSLVFMFLLTIRGSVSGQVDSLEGVVAGGTKTEMINALMNLSDIKAASRDWEKAEGYARRAFEISGNDYPQKIEALKKIALIYREQELWAKSEITYAKALDLMDSLKAGNDEISRKKASLLLDISRIHMMYSAQYSVAHELIVSAMSMAEKIQDSALMIRAYRYLAFNYRHLEDYGNALLYSDKAIDIARILKDTIVLSDALNEKANILILDTKDYQTADMLYKEALKYAELASDTYAISFINHDIGNMYFDQGKHVQALKYLLYSFRLDYGQKKFRELCITSSNIAMCYMELGDYQQATDYLERGLKYARELDLKAEKLELYEGFSKLMARMGKYKDAYDYQVKYNSLYDSLFNGEKEKLIAEITTKYETEKKDKENEMLRQQNTIKSLKIAQDKSRFRSVVIIGAVVAIFGGLFLYILYRSNRNRKQANRILEEKNRKISLQKDTLAEALDFLSRRERELEGANATKDRFFSIIAHDLKNPLSSLIGLVNLLHDDFDRLEAAKQKAFIRNIRESSNSLYALLENLLQWARSQTKQIDLKPETVGLHGLFESSFGLYRNAAAYKNITLINDVPVDLEAFADRGMVDVVVRNLLSNAIKFTGRDGSIRVAAERQDGKVQVEVADNGVGMSREDLAKLFRIDQKMHRRGTANEQGTGLGLIICREFIEMNGGGIRVESEPGKGSRFIFTLPEGKS
jgi:signal transduction histidine kinase